MCGCRSRFPQSMQELALLLVSRNKCPTCLPVTLRLLLSCQPGLLHMLPVSSIIEHQKICYSWKGYYVIKRQKSSDRNNIQKILCHALSAIIYCSWLIRFSFIRSVTLVCLLMVDFSDVAAGDWTVHEHVEPQPWAPWHVWARDKVFLRLKRLRQGRRQQQGHQASCEEEVVRAKSA